MDVAKNARVKRIVLLSLLCLTGVSAIGIVAILVFNSGHGRFEEMAVVSGLGLGYLLLMAFAGYTALDRERLRWVAGAGMGLAVIMMMVVPAYGWWEMTRTWGRGFDYSMERWISERVGTGIATVSALCLIPFVLAPKMKAVGQVVQACTAVAMGGTYLVFLGVLWGAGGPDWGQFMLAGIVVSFGGTLAVHVMNKMFGITMPDPLTSVEGTIHLRCPRCSQEQEVALGESTCGRCKLKIKVEVEEPRCPECGYNLRALTRAVCPECGARLNAEAVSEELVAWVRAADDERARQSKGSSIGGR